jgi:hypothetical protein
MSSYPASMPLGSKLFRLVFWELMHQTGFQFIGSMMGSVSPLALRVILAHMDTTGTAAQQSIGMTQDL